ncbi:DUF190 domain-containing protein [Candidatus Venteria ishoeyi]|uniref:Uncharacterized protein n=2 Tax=Candidatus Venteria ishoeyi TaxID=1899563 RepID=A0A1H6FAJ6_9GAMM|nr:DUF190 domain-containing protein [Candidatus Venteria ishoeyi]MDM8545974.1 DUF190 domain-containing protein [Candidatus Venteria ishoeyi]SEH06054.1 Uncharacterised protein [Candidatus Venteria ishoeyi]
MNHQDVLFVRVYLTEAKQAQLKQLLKVLHDDYHISGVTLFRGISGFGDSRQLHEAHLLDLSLDLPIALEFFDEAEKIKPVLVYLEQEMKPGHWVYWPARTGT